MFSGGNIYPCYLILPCVWWEYIPLLPSILPCSLVGIYTPATLYPTLFSGRNIYPCYLLSYLVLWWEYIPLLPSILPCSLVGIYTPALEPSVPSSYSPQSIPEKPNTEPTLGRDIWWGFIFYSKGANYGYSRSIFGFDRNYTWVILAQKIALLCLKNFWD